MRGQRDKVAFFFRRADAFFVALAILLLFSCGLPTSDYLYPPAGFSSPSGNLVQLVHDTRNIYEVAELFRGYDIYYRIFDNRDDAIDSSIYLSEYLTSGNITSIASSQGYYVLVKYDKNNALVDTAPLIPVSDNSYDYFDLNLKSSERWTITSEDETTIYSIVRDKKTATSTYADFYLSANYEKGDLDYESDGISDNDDGSVYIVFFAVAYGISSSLSEIYSDPIVLEPIPYAPGS